jgi:hypothetical protein
MEQGVPVGTPLRFLLQARAPYDKLNSFPLRRLAHLCSGCYRCTVPVAWDQQDEKHEDNQKHDGPTGISSKCSVHKLPPPLLSVALDVCFEDCPSEGHMA